MRNKFFFSNDGLTFIDMSQISSIAKKNTSSAFWTIYLHSGANLTVVGDMTLVELFDALAEYSIQGE